MKVSKPVLIFAIVVLLLAAYIFFFTGKKKASAPVSAAPPGQPATPAQQPSAPPKTPSQETGQKSTPSEGTSSIEKPRFDAVKTAWVHNPFLLPPFAETKKKETLPGARLSAIFEKGRDRIAIIDHEILRKGDAVGDEKVLEIGRDSVTLTRGGIIRILYLAGIENTPREEEPKAKTTEKSK